MFSLCYSLSIKLPACFSFCLFVSILSEIENSGTISIAKPHETEQPETDCDVGEAPDTHAAVDQPSFVRPHERWVWAADNPVCFWSSSNITLEWT